MTSIILFDVNYLIYISCIMSFSLLGFNIYLRGQHHSQKKRLEQLQHQLRILSGGSLGMGKKLIEIEDRFRVINQRQDDVELHQDPKDSAYHQATKLFASGMSLDQVVDTCQISPSEAKLIDALAKKSS